MSIYFLQFNQFAYFSPFIRIRPIAPANGPTILPEANLDPSDFPALSGGTLAPSSQTPSLLSSYASQAGTGILPTTLQNGVLPSPGSLSPGAGLTPGANALLGTTAREFSQDDFPALNGFGGGAHELGMGLPPSLANLGPVTNGSMSGRSTSSSEQASAAAALQHQLAQQQHRANLLGSMNGNISGVRCFSFSVFALVLMCSVSSHSTRRQSLLNGRDQMQVCSRRHIR